MIAALVLPLLALQATGETAVAIPNDNPETWSVEYPRLIQPFVADYRRCLALTNRRIAGKADFGTQHEGDVARCAEARAKAIGDASAALDGAKTTMTREELDQLFTDIGRIHIARGNDLDKQFLERLSGAEAAGDAYEANRPKGLVIELRDASVVKATTDAAAAAAQQDKDG